MWKIHLCSTWFLLFLIHFLQALTHDQPQVYIVYLGEHKSGDKSVQEIEQIHRSYLHSVKGSTEGAQESIIYSYKNVINGFSALLTPDEAVKLSEMEDVISVFRSDPMEYSLHTTRSWDFVNLLEQANNSSKSSSHAENSFQKANYGDNVIVGVFDSGVWPESESFSDEGMGPIPESWKGVCEEGDSFDSSNCNRKLIGARYYVKSYERRFGRLNSSLDYRSARDKNGHGTHTASTIAGRSVPNASTRGGFARGTAIGGAPLAHLAIYKVCWPHRTLGRQVCLGDDMLAAFDDAIGDGVQVISISIGFPGHKSFSGDTIAVGAWHAERRNILVVCSAGNDGPKFSTAVNLAPWILTVAASSIDRVFDSPVLLGNGIKIQGQSTTLFELQKMQPLVYAGDVEVAGSTKNITTGLCNPETLSEELVKGKVVLCLVGDVAQAYEVKRAGGVAAILGNKVDRGDGIKVYDFVLPATTVSPNDATRILHYIQTKMNPTATLIPATTRINTKPAPIIAPFSSTGPSTIQPNILKPDITAPGLNILAAWTEGSTLTSLPNDTRVVKYNIASGTSMSCPHVAAAATIIRAIHPHWSSGAIKSALMTTATITNNMGMPMTDHNGNLATPFQYGAGHFEPGKAADPGLVYNTTDTDYIIFLCKSEVEFLDPSVKCPKNLLSPSDLNYPSITIAGLNGTVTVNRVLTSVGTKLSTYSSTVEAPVGYSVKISPRKLVFTRFGERKSFKITIRENGIRQKTNGDYAFGWLVWSDEIHSVRSSIVVSSS